MFVTNYIMITDENKVTLDGLTSILSNISNRNEPNTSIYVSVGSAALSAHRDNISNVWTINDQLNQQYPKFLKSLKNLLPFSPVHILLIDPGLENPPFIVWDNTTDNTKPGVKWQETNIYKQFNIDHFENMSENINVYVVRKYVCYAPYERDELTEMLNISLFLTQLDLESIEHNWFTVFNDFSGVVMPQIALVHDETLKGTENHLNHVIYGIGARKDGGCHFDLTAPECDFVYDITPRGIKVFNPFCSTCHDGDLLPSLQFLAEMDDASDKHKRDYQIAIAQIGEYIKYKRRIILYDVMTLVRQFGKLIKDSTQVDKKGIYINNLYIKATYGINLKELYEKEQYFEIFYKCVYILKEELKEHIFVAYGKDTNEIVEKTVLDMIVNLDPYAWYNCVLQLLKEFDKKTGREIKIEY